MKNDSASEIAVALLVLLFSYASVSKLLEYDKFMFQMRLSQVHFIQATSGILAWLIPVAEIIIVLLLVVPATRTLGLYTSLSLLFCFSIYIGVMLVSGIKLPCTCGGVISKMSWKTHLLFNSIFMLITITAIYRRKKIQQIGLTTNTDLNFSRV